MPPLIAVVLVGVGAIAGYKAARRLWGGGDKRAAPGASRDDGPAGDAEASGAKEKDLGALEFDPVAGVYKPISRD